MTRNPLETIGETMQNFNKYLSRSPVDENWGFFITTVGYSRIDPNQSYPVIGEHPSSHAFTWNKGRILDDYYLVFISKGRGKFESAENTPVEVNTGTCFFLYPGVWHRYKPDAHSGWEEYWVGFRGYYPEYLMTRNFFDRKIPAIQTGLNENLQRLFHKLLETVKDAAPGYHQIISGITLEILGQVNSIAPDESNNRNTSGKYIEQAIFRMRESIDQPLTMEELLAEIPVSYSKFRQDFKKLTGFSPNQYYLDIRLDKAKELLSTTSLQVNEIAWHTGFESIFYFSKLFKKRNGMSPRGFRNIRDDLI